MKIIFVYVFKKHGNKFVYFSIFIFVFNERQGFLYNQIKLNFLIIFYQMQPIQYETNAYSLKVKLSQEALAFYLKQSSNSRLWEGIYTKQALSNIIAQSNSSLEAIFGTFLDENNF